VPAVIVLVPLCEMRSQSPFKNNVPSGCECGHGYVRGYESVFETCREGEGGGVRLICGHMFVTDASFLTQQA